MVRWFFLLIHFLIVEDYELPKSIIRILSVPLTLECVRIISLSMPFFFYFNYLPDDVLSWWYWWSSVRFLSELTILLANHMANKLTQLSQQVKMCRNVILKRWKCNTRNIKKFSLASNYMFIFGKLFYVYKLIHIDLKPRILIASFLLTPFLNN